MSKYRHSLMASVLSMAAAMPGAASAEEESGYASATFEQRRALSQRIRQLRKLRKRLPVPVPSGLFGIYAFPEKGQGVAGIVYQHHEFDGLIRGSDSVSAEEVVTSAPNPFFGDPGQPPTLRVVPTEVSADVAFPFANFAVNERLAVVGLVPLVRKKTTLETFAGPTGTTSLGTTEVTSSGLGDIKFGVIYKLYDSPDYRHNLLLDAGLSAPTGNITEEDYKLTPTGAMVKSRLPYGMQLGSGTWDGILGLVYWGKEGKWGWGAQYLATFPLESENSEGWRYDDQHMLTGWVSYSWNDRWVSAVRLKGETQGEIHGIDPEIYGPGLGADPGNYGGQRVELGLSVNWMPVMGNNLGLEVLLPVHQDRNGVQPEHEFSLALSWRHGFF